MNETAKSMADEVLCARNNGAIGDILGNVFGTTIMQVEYKEIYRDIYDEVNTYDYSNGLKFSDNLCTEVTNFFMASIVSIENGRISVISREDFDKTDVKRWENILRRHGLAY